MNKKFFFLLLTIILLPSLVLGAPPPPPATPGSPSAEEISTTLLFENPSTDEIVIQNQRVEVKLIFINDENAQEVTLLQNDEIINTWSSEPYETNIQINEVGTYELDAYATVNEEQIRVDNTRKVEVEPLPSGVGEIIERPPATEETPEETVECQATYICQEWSECVEGQQTRMCEDINECREDQEVTRECEVTNTININQETYDLIPREGGYFIDATLENDKYNVTLSAELASLFEVLTANNNLYEAEKARNTQYVLTKIEVYQSPQQAAPTTNTSSISTLLTTLLILLSLTIVGFILTKKGTVNNIIKETQITSYLKRYATNSKKQIKELLNINNNQKRNTNYNNIAVKAKKKQKEREKLRKFLRNTSGTMREKKQALIKAGWQEERVEKEINELLKEKAL